MQFQLTQMLFLGCGDLLNPLYAVAGSSENQKLSIHINDDNFSVIARNILILKIVFNPDFDTNSNLDINYVWDVWCNATWPQSTVERFLKDIKELLDEPLPVNVILADLKSKEKLQSIWKEWLCTIETVSMSDLQADR